MPSRVKTGSPNSGSPSTGSSKDGDGRSTRWDDHREARRAELVAAAVTAIDLHGPQASIAEIAASAGVSKPVLYRYFTDKDDLYRAVGQWGAEQVLDRVVPTLIADGTMRERVYRGCDAYLGFLAEHPQVFLLLVEHRSAADPLANGKEEIASTFAKLMGDTLRRLGVDAAGAEPWAHGLIGMGLSVGEWWLRRDIMTRQAAGQYLAAFIWHAFSGFAADNGVSLDGPGALRVVADSSAPSGRPAAGPTKTAGTRARRKDA